MGKTLPANKKRVQLLVTPATFNLIKRFAKEDGSQGRAIDKMARLRAKTTGIGFRMPLFSAPETGKAMAKEFESLSLLGREKK